MSEPTTPTSQPIPVPASKSVPANAAMTRRNFLWLGWSALVVFFTASAAATARFFFPNVIYEPSQKFNAGPAKDYPMGVSLKWQNEQRVWIERNEKGFTVFWARCTHLGCTPNWFADQNRFRCPCHGSNFNIEGDVIAGPAPKPLYRCAVEIASTGDLIIDKAILENRPGFRDKSPFFAQYQATV
ncbi:MAG: ubiquinol-cytochrome c reductase iron-sulfur subunit [Elusimicrobia bacterium]|nr:ubiquinol-cytochrome c reductase iron-sulfur subunit [Elusimicrobiota bacterium]